MGAIVTLVLKSATAQLSNEFLRNLRLGFTAVWESRQRNVHFLIRYGVGLSFICPWRYQEAFSSVVRIKTNLKTLQFLLSEPINLYCNGGGRQSLRQ